MKIISRVLAVITFAGWVGSASAIPITSADIVTVDGTEWAQVDLFSDLSWNDINAVCPAGVCNDGAALNGYDITGWLWASADDINELFNHYIGYEQLGPGPDNFTQSGAMWANAFFADGWRETSNISGRDELLGISSTLNSEIAHFRYSVTNLIDPVGLDRIGTTGGGLNDSSWWFVGAFLYKSPTAPQSGVPVPTTFVLFGLGLAGLGWARRKNPLKRQSDIKSH